MKKKAIILVAVAVVALVAASCTHHTCPAYRGSNVDAQPSSAVELALAE